MVTRYEIHPSIGIARLGNSQEVFYLAPETIGGLPRECDPIGNPLIANGMPKRVERFKDEEGRIKRQGAQFKIFAYDSANPKDPGREVTLEDAEIESIEWTVHLANKKAAWYENAELEGNLMLGEKNSYKKRGVPLRNANIQGKAARQKLIIDPGPRSVCQPDQQVEFSRENIPNDYKYGSFPDPNLSPYPIQTLGRIMMDRVGRLVVLGGYGNACGETVIATYTGSDTWYDDISDGPVYCHLKVRGKKIRELKAWVIVGSPKVAPELRNISTLDDVMYDVGVRYLNLMPQLYNAKRWRSTGGWNPNYVANYKRDIEPIIERPADYIWVANVPSMIAFSYPRFDPADVSEKNRQNRENYFRYFRQPGQNELGTEHEVLMSSNGIPMMPLNSGTNSVTNQNIDKFMSLTLTQYMLLKQWAEGKFENDETGQPPPGVHPLDQASVGNCVGHPMSPGIEVTWNTRNPAIYETPYIIKHRYTEDDYRKHGLDPSYDECQCVIGQPPAGQGDGCEPGDLTKRMSPPWQSDFYQCSIEYINFSDPKVNVNEATQIPPPPTYYAYWWPPQAPMHVMSGAMTAEEQNAAGVTGGYQVYYTRGANNINLLVVSWKYMGFILNQNVGDDRHEYPYFVEVERNHDRFIVASVAVGQPINQLAASGSYPTEDNYFIPVWYMKDEDDNPGAGRRAKE
jgi:L-lysine 6-oxidase